MKKFVSVLMVLCVILSLTAVAGATPVAKEQIKVGYIMIGDENEGYTQSHVDAIKSAAAAIGLSDDQVIIKWNTSEGEVCYEAAADLADSGCNIIFSNSYGHESYMIQAAKEYPEVQLAPPPATRPPLPALPTYTTISPPSTRAVIWLVWWPA